MMLALAKNYGGGSVYLKDIAKGEEIRGFGLVKSIRGAHGGYALAKSPAEITLKDIVDILEGDCLVDCVKDPASCSRMETCASRDVWELVGGKISDVLGSITLEKLVQMDEDKAKGALGANI